MDAAVNEAGARTRTGMAAMLSAGWPLPPATIPVRLGALRRTALAVEERWPDVMAPDELDRDEIVRELSERVASNRWSGCPLRLVCAGIRAAFDKERRGHRDLANLRTFYFREIAATDRQSLLRAALATYLESFDPGAPHTRELARRLASARLRLPPKERDLLRQVPNLFDPRRVVEDIATIMIESAECHQRLVEIGIRSPHGPGLMDHVHLSFVRRVSGGLADSDAADRLLNWLQPQGKPARRAGAAEAINAIVRPWLRKDPPPERQTVLARRLVEMYGDPRMNSGDPWHLIERAQRDVFLRWLAGENLRLLFDAITDTNDSHMWNERREFYLELHRQKRIDAAWVAFAPAGERRARALLESAGHGNAREFGKQIARGTRVNTSLLIVKVGTKTIVDGSHSYKVHIFHERHRRAPQFYQSQYDCEQIRISSLENKTHHKNWQHWVLMRI